MWLLRASEALSPSSGPKEEEGEPLLNLLLVLHHPTSVDGCREGKPVGAVPRHGSFTHPALGRKRMEKESGKAGGASPTHGQ